MVEKVLAEHRFDVLERQALRDVGYQIDARQAFAIDIHPAGQVGPAAAHVQPSRGVRQGRHVKRSAGLSRGRSGGKRAGDLARGLSRTRPVP